MPFGLAGVKQICLTVTKVTGTHCLKGHSHRGERSLTQPCLWTPSLVRTDLTSYFAECCCYVSPQWSYDQGSTSLGVSAGWEKGHYPLHKAWADQNQSSSLKNIEDAAQVIKAINTF